MKKIAFIYHTYEEYFTAFKDEAPALHLDLEFIQYGQMHFQFSQNQTKIYFNNRNIDEYNLVYFRNAWRNPELSTLISAYCKTNSIPVVDPVFTQNSPWIDRKSFEYLTLIENNLPIVPSKFISLDSVMSGLEIEYPAIAKITDSSQGVGVFLVQNKEELIEVYAKSKKSHLMIQKYIKNNGDYRIFVIDGQIVSAIKRYAADDQEFRNNISRGGKSMTHDVTPEEQKIAIKAAQVMNYSIAGVDLIYDENNELKILEVNRSPHFLGLMKQNNINIPKKILNLLIKNCK